MSTVGSFDRFLHFSELNSPLFDQTGVLSPSVRKQIAASNLGLMLPSAQGGAEVFRQMPTPATAIDTATLTVTQIGNGIILGTPTAAAAYTMPLATAMDTAFPDFLTNDALQFNVVNKAATATFDITMTTNTGWTLNGPMVVGAGSSAAGDGSEWTAGTFRAQKTGTGTWTLFRVG